MDDLTALEIINLLNIGLSSYNFKSHVASDIPSEALYVDSSNLKTQDYLHEMDRWSKDHQMIISKKKTKAIMFNYTHNYQIGTRITLEGENIEFVDKIKLLGTWVSNKLTWNENCTYLIQKVNKRMQLLRRILSFGASKDEMVHFWIIFCRSVLEQSCVVWHNSLTQENIDDLERLQKTFTKLILKQEYESYEKALLKLNLDTLENRREEISKKFAKNGIQFNTLKDLLRKKKENVNFREAKVQEMYHVQFANTERLKKSAIINLQNLLNKETTRKS